MKSAPRRSLALAFIAMMILGWSLGWKSNSTPVRAASLPGHALRPMRSSHSPGPKGEAAERHAAILATRDPLERTRATLALANSLSPAEFAAWLDGGWFKQREGADATLFEAILLNRWPQEDIEGFLAWGLKNHNDAADEIVSSWVDADPQRLLDFFKFHPNREAEFHALAKIAAKNPVMALKRLQQLQDAGMTLGGIYDMRDILKEIAKQPPGVIDTVIDSLTGRLRSYVELHHIERKMDTAFSEEVGKLIARSDGFRLFEQILWNSNSLKAKLFSELANFPDSWRARIGSSPSAFVGSGNAEEWITTDLEGLGFTEKHALNIRAHGIEELISSEPETALKLMPEIKLSADQRRYNLTKLFRNLTDKPAKAQELIVLLTSDEDRQIANDAMIEKVSKQEPEIAPVKEPADWLREVAELKPENPIPFQYYSVLLAWNTDKLADLSRQFLSLPDDKKPNVARSFLNASEYPPLVGDGVRYFISHPELPVYLSADDSPNNSPDDPFAEAVQKERVSQHIELASTYVGKIALQDPQSAVQWINSLPDGTPKLWASKNLQAIWSQYDPQAADAWLKSLPTTTQSQIKSVGAKPDADPFDPFAPDADTLKKENHH